jgi:hypothetical protein
MYVCIYVCIYVCMYLFIMYVFMYVCIYVCTYVYMYARTYVRTYICMHVCKYVGMYVWTKRWPPHVGRYPILSTDAPDTTLPILCSITVSLIHKFVPHLNCTYRYSIFRALFHSEIQKPIQVMHCSLCYGELLIPLFYNNASIHKVMECKVPIRIN